MTTPTGPTPGKSDTPPIQPIQTGAPPPSKNKMDPTGAWSKFLSTPGNAASADDVKMFMQGMLRMFNVLIQQQNEAYQRSNEQLKKAAQGDE